MSTVNPLLSADPHPRFDLIEAEHVQPAMSAALASANAALDALEAAPPTTSDALLAALEQMQETVGRPWLIVEHLIGVKNSPALREAHQAAQPELVRFNTRMGQSRALYDAAVSLRGSDGALSSAQKRALEGLVSAAEVTGVALEGESRERYAALLQKKAELSRLFTNHKLDAVKAWSHLITAPASVEGLPASWRERAASRAREAGSEGATADAGPWLTGLDSPSFFPVMEHSRDRALRELLRRSYYQVANGGDLDNRPIVEALLRARAEQAAMLGYGSYAEVSLTQKMAPSVEAIEALLNQLEAAARPAAQAELADLQALAAEAGAPELEVWDEKYWAERLREQRYDLRDEELRPYFAMDSVLEALFSVAETLYNIKVTAADGEVPVWHPDVRFFRVSDGESGEAISTFYLDAFARPGEKSSGAWMGYFTGRSTVLAPAGASAQLPVAVLICNQSPPSGDAPSLMSFGEVRTLFHEFGHALHHMLTTQDEGLVAGILGVEWDAVELPSQFMENWAYEPDVLHRMARHYETGEALPEATLARMRAARTFRAGSGLLRQLHFARLDLALHHRWRPGDDPVALDRAVRDAHSLLLSPPEDNFLNIFGHLFSGGYAAGYYGYKWAEVLAADAFAAFEEAGLEPESVRRMGDHFRAEVLGVGGGVHPMAAFERFRGRPPSPEPLLRHSGLTG